MKYIYLRITNRCNLRCPHCYIPEYKGDMSHEVLESVYNYFLNDDKVILLHGGEPILAGKKMLFKVIQMFREDKKVNGIYIQTNLHYDVIEYIDVFTALDGVGTSMDEGRDNEVLYKNIDRLIENKIVPRVNITITDNYIKSGKFAEDIRFIESRGLNFRIEPYAFSIGRIKTFSYTDYMRIVYDYMNHPLYDAKSTVCGTNKVVVGGDCAKQGLRVVDVDGEVYVCPNFAGYKQFSLGNIQDENFTDSLKSDKLGMRIFHQRQKELVLNTECGQCSNYLLCEGGCVANNIFMNYNKLKTDEDFIMVKNPYCEGVKWFYQDENL